MPEQENVDLIRRLYEAFGKGDLDTIIDHLASQFVWRFDAPSTVPFAGDFKTPDEVRRGFFGTLAETQKDQALKPEEFIAQDDKVVLNNYALIPGPGPKTVKVINMNAGKIREARVFPLYASPAWPSRN